MHTTTIRLLAGMLLVAVSYSCNKPEKEGCPLADFSTNLSEGIAPLWVNFDNSSVDGATYHWDFGDGSSSTLVEPGSHQFTTPGTYKVTLTVTSATSCSDKITKEIVVHPSSSATVANFTVSTAGYAPLEVTFVNTSQNATSYIWDFGDGSAPETTANPTHTYKLSTYYTVKLTAIGPLGTDEYSQVLEIDARRFVRSYGASGDCIPGSARQLSDDSYIMAGTVFEGTQTQVYLVKADEAGTKQWEKTFGDPSGDEEGSYVALAADNGFVITGFTRTEGAGGSDLLLMKTDEAGNLLWKKTFGGTSDEKGACVQTTRDGGYIVVGFTSSQGAGQKDVFLLKTDAQGNELWSKTFGGASDDAGYSVQQIEDEGFILAGETASKGLGGFDAWLIRTDKLGTVVWDKTFGSPNNDSGQGVIETTDGSFMIIYGNNENTGTGTVLNNYVLKTDASGTRLWSTASGIYGSNRAIAPTSDGGCIVLSTSYPNNSGLTYLNLQKIYSNGGQTTYKSYDIGASPYGASCMETSDGGFILFGSAIDAQTQKQAFKLLKTDQAGE